MIFDCAVRLKFLAVGNVTGFDSIHTVPPWLVGVANKLRLVRLICAVDVRVGEEKRKSNWP